MQYLHWFTLASRSADRVAVTNRVPIAILKPTAPQKKSKVKSQKSKFASRLLPLA